MSASRPPLALLAVLSALLVAGALLLAAPARAAGTATPPPPPPPQVDFSGLPDSAVDRGVNGDGKPHQVEIRLITDTTAVRPGDTFRLGLWLEQDQDWHTYWKVNPEVGLPTDITWTVPEGATTTPYVYPVPQRFDLQGIVSYGYDDQVLFFTEVTLPEDLTPGTVMVGASATWLTCKVQCINGEGTVTAPMQVLPADAPAPEASRFAPLFDHFAAQHPSAPQAVADTVRVSAALDPAEGVVPDSTWTVTVDIDPVEGVTLAEHAPLGPDPWPTLVPIFDKDVHFLDRTEVTRTDAGGFQVVMHGEAFEVENPLPMEVGGLVMVETADGTPVHTEVVIPMPWAPSVTAAAATGSEDAPTEAAPAGDAAFSPMVDADTCATMKAGLGNAPATPTSSGGLGTTLLMLGAAFLGGLILNIMPCVLPVLTLKIYGLIEQKTDSTRDRIVEGVAYTAGIVVSFLALAAALLALKLVWGQTAGWGFMFQYPIYTGVLATLVFAFGLSLLGVFEIPALGGAAAGQASYKEGVPGYFLTGVFATLLATPCTAPFLGTAMGFAFSQPPAMIVLFFAVAGLGLASPFLAIAFIPALYKVMPQPGPWMDTFKQLMGFTLVLTTAWLVGVLASQVSQEALLGYLWFLGFVGLAAWIFGHFGGLAASVGRQLAALGGAVAVLLLGGAWTLEVPMFLGLVQEESTVADVLDDGDGIPWRILDEERMASVLARYREGQTDEAFAGKPLFIDFTAEWCLTCKANEKTFIDVSSVEKAIRETGTVPLKGDWTRRDENIGSWLSCYETAGVPYYLVLPADPEAPAIPLGETLTGSQEIIDALQQARGPVAQGS